MIKTVEELKEFVIWAKKQKLQHVKVGEVEFVFSNLALLDETESDSGAYSEGLNPRAEAIRESLQQSGSKDYDDETLFYSSDT